MRVVGLTYRQLDYWTRKGYLRAEKATPGSGYPRSWPVEEHAIARAMVRLVGCGFTVPRAAEIARSEFTSEWLEIGLCPGVTLRLMPDLWSPGDEEPPLEPPATMNEETDGPPTDRSAPGPQAPA